MCWQREAKRKGEPERSAPVFVEDVCSASVVQFARTHTHKKSRGVERRARNMFTQSRTSELLSSTVAVVSVYLHDDPNALFPASAEHSHIHTRERKERERGGKEQNQGRRPRR
jgi:hypothetical protein